MTPANGGLFVKAVSNIPSKQCDLNTGGEKGGHHDNQNKNKDDTPLHYLAPFYSCAFILLSELYFHASPNDFLVAG
jgi:hypothetical protein